MNIDDKGSTSQSSIIGTVISLGLFLLLAGYGIYKCNLVLNNESFNMNSTVREGFFTSDKKFNYDNGFAFAITLWNDLDPSIGNLVITSDEWNNSESGEKFYRNTELQTHICTDEELGLSESEDGSPPVFFPIRAGQANDIKKKAGKLLCIDKDEMRIHGSFDADVARLMQVKLNRCTGEGCADPDTITNSFKG